MRRLALTALAAGLLIPAPAHARPSTFLHTSEAQLVQRHVGYQRADKVRAFRVAFGSCVRRSRSSIDCPVSLWRWRYGITEKGQLLVRVHKGRRGVSAVTRTFWGYADPQVPEPKRPARPSPERPAYPGYGDGFDYTPHGG